jgi:hypothetical protein
MGRDGWTPMARTTIDTEAGQGEKRTVRSWLVIFDQLPRPTSMEQINWSAKLESERGDRLHHLMAELPLPYPCGGCRELGQQRIVVETRIGSCAAMSSKIPSLTGHKIGPLCIFHPRND